MKLVKTTHPVMMQYKMQTTYLLVVFAIVTQHTFAENFLEILKKCKVTDPKLDDCILNSANSLMSVTYKGSEKYGLPPLMITNSTATYNLTEKFNLKLTNLTVHFGDGFVVTAVHLGIPEKLLTFTAKCPHVRHESNYEAAGEILGKPAHENGKLNMSFDDIELNGSVPLEFTTKDDKKYLEAVSCKLNVTAKNFQFNPAEQVTVGEPMTDEQKKEYQSYIDNIPTILRNQYAKHDKEILAVINKIFQLPFGQLFAQ